MSALYIHAQFNHARAKETGYPGVQVLGWRYAAHSLGEGPGLCSPGQGGVASYALENAGGLDHSNVGFVVC